MQRAAPLGFAEKFRGTTRGQIVDLLRCRAMTTDELAVALKLTVKGVRVQLMILERDGLVRQLGRRRSGAVGKPAAIYEFDSAAEPLFSSGYAPVLVAALDVLKAKNGPRDRIRSLRRIGVELAEGLAPSRAREIHDRVRVGVSVLTAWGGLPRVERSDGTLFIRSCGCPVSAAVRAHPETCIVVEAMLAKLIKAPVHECCDRSNRPSCCFQIPANGNSRAGRSRGSGSKRSRTATG
jgi:predicted ArsR family transcriptional regulator